VSAASRLVGTLGLLAAIAHRSSENAYRKASLIAFLFASSLSAADAERLALARQAQTAFDRVEQASAPPLADAAECAQSQAAMLAVALPTEQTLLHYHKGYCELAAAAITRGADAFVSAAAELDKGGAPVLASIARLRAGQAVEARSIVAGVSATCPAFCDQASRLWLGWLALRGQDLNEAAREFAAQPESGWSAWVAGRKAFQGGQYAEAAAQYRQAADTWGRAQRDPWPALAARLAPPPEQTLALTELGAAELLSGHPVEAITTLNAAVQSGPPDARAFYLRARAKELAGQREQALEDYNMASRTAFANATGLASGEAHLYRGIMLYRRRDFARAEDEFSSALNLEVPAALRPDTSAWRHLSAVADGFCAASREYLERSLPTVSPFFPKDEAKALAARCASTHSGL